MSNPQEIAEQFVKFYYGTFDADRATLQSLYRDDSMLQFEQKTAVGWNGRDGQDGIMKLLTELPFQKVQHRVNTLDAQPSAQDGLIVLVTGQLLVDEEQNVMNYTQTFQLKDDGNKSFYVLNDIFRLVYG